MRAKLLKIFIMSVHMVGLSYTSPYAVEIEFRGQASAWYLFNDNTESSSQLGVRYIPEISIWQDINKPYQIDCMVSGNGFGYGDWTSLNNFEGDCDLEAYRAWARLSSNQFEVRVGLQKINFGSATLLRPLMWFDTIDPRDPLQITDAIWGLLVRYYFLNNANVWLWGLYGNDEPKGLEIFWTEKSVPELGGRIQYPIPGGEIAFTYHHRKADLNKGLFTSLPIDNNRIVENRFGFDAKVDIEVGIWVEGALIHQENEWLPYDWRRLGTVGMDYTFGIGNGITVLAEHFISETAKETFGTGDGSKLSAMSLSYPAGLLDNFTAIFYYDWENKKLYRFVNWQRTYDRWTFHLMGFWNPDRYLIYQSTAESSYFNGKGLQIMVVFNH